MQNYSRDYPTYSPNSKILQSRHEISPFGKRNQSVFVAREKEQDKQHKYFQNSKVESCSFVFVKGGSALAMPYYSPNYLEKHNSPSPNRNQKKQRSISTVTQESYAQKQYTHAGQRNKPMEPYHMNAQRNRLIIQEPKIPRGNSSSIMFGDQFHPYKRTFITTSKLYFEKPNLDFYSLQQNEGIISDKIKYTHYLQNL
ncbi:hypothetical protein ABPG72_009195 [Tetrahymena utriculariae]